MEELELMNTVIIHIQTCMAQILTFQKKKKNKQKRLESNGRNSPRSSSFSVLNLLSSFICASEFYPLLTQTFCVS